MAWDDGGNWAAQEAAADSGGGDPWSGGGGDGGGGAGGWAAPEPEWAKEDPEPVTNTALDDDGDTYKKADSDSDSGAAGAAKGRQCCGRECGTCDKLMLFLIFVSLVVFAVGCLMLRYGQSNQTATAVGLLVCGLLASGIFTYGGFRCLHWCGCYNETTAK